MNNYLKSTTIVCFYEIRKKSLRIIVVQIQRQELRDDGFVPANKGKIIYYVLHGNNIYKSTKSLVDLNPRLLCILQTHEGGQCALKRGSFKAAGFKRVWSGTAYYPKTYPSFSTLHFTS